MGRPRKSKKIKQLEGNRSRADLKAYDEPDADGLLVMPDDLDADAQECWSSVIHQVTCNGAGAGDSLRLAGMCRWYSRYIKLERLMAESPAPDYRLMMMAVTAWKSFDAAASKMGLSPTDRTQLRTEPKKTTDNKWMGLLA